MIILNIDMPKCCDECPISVELVSGEVIGACPITHTWGTNHDKERYENCPLSELKGENNA